MVDVPPGVAVLIEGPSDPGGLASVGSVLLAEDLLLLLTDKTKGRFDAVVELALMGRVEFAREVKSIRFLGTWWGGWAVDRLIVGDPAATGDAVLDTALQITNRCQGKLSTVIHARWPMPLARDLPFGPEPQGGSLPLQLTLYKRLGSSGMVRHERRRTLMVNFALTKVDQWPAQDSRHKVEVRRRVIQALGEQTTPDTRSAALIALLHTIELEPEIVDPGQLTAYRAYGNIEIRRTRSQLLGRGEEIAKSNWAPDAVRKPIDAIIATTRKAAQDTIAKEP